MKILDKTTATVDGNGNIIIQNADNSVINIDLSKSDKVRDALLTLQNRIKDLPLDIINLLMEHNSDKLTTSGANVYLGFYYLMGGLNRGCSLGVTVTNLNKEHRYFYEPIFKTSIPFENELSSFKLISVVGEQIKFPIRLEYGEQFTINYEIKNIDFLYSLFRKCPDCTLVSIVSTTLGETFSSNEYKIEKLKENFETVSK